MITPLCSSTEDTSISNEQILRSGRPLLQFRLRFLAWIVFSCSLLALWFRPSTEGLPTQSGRQLDVAIFGQGYFQIQNTDTGEFYYTRNGRFSLNSDGMLIVGRQNDHWLLMPQVSIPQDWRAIEISPTGHVSVRDASTDSIALGQIQLAKFINPEALMEVFPNIYAETESSGSPVFASPGIEGLAFLKQEWIEYPDPVWTLNRASIALLLALTMSAILILVVRDIHGRLDRLSLSVEKLCREVIEKT